MSILAKVGISRCLDFYLSKNDRRPQSISPDKDIFVGQKQHLEMDIPGGKTFRARDIIVWGKLTVRSDSEVPVQLVSRATFAPGSLEMNNVCLSSRYTYTNGKELEKELLDLIIDWFRFQRENVNRMGLRSSVILV